MFCISPSIAFGTRSVTRSSCPLPVNDLVWCVGPCPLELAACLRAEVFSITRPAWPKLLTWMLVHVPWKYAELLFLNPRTIEKTSAFALQWSYEVKCLCSRTWSQVTDVALTASGVIDGATFSLLQLCQVTLSAELSLHAGCTLWSWKSLGSSGNHILALKQLFNVGSSICGNPSSR